MSEQLLSNFDIFIKLSLAGILGGMIGLERQSLRKSAGFRTHILVCLGSALIMVISLDIFRVYHSLTTVDPGRLAAQVVSGIGFLGAGTIMREGVNVKGLTTAASLWVVSGIGLAVGIGLYGAAVIATFLVFLALMFLGRMEKYIRVKNPYVEITLKVIDEPGVIGAVGTALGKLNVSIRHLETKGDGKDLHYLLEVACQLPEALELSELIQALILVKGVEMAKIEE